MKATFEIDSAKLRAYLAGMSTRVTDMSPAMLDVSKMLEEDVRANFATAGPGWPMHAESTTKRHGKHPLLMHSRTLFGSFRRQVTPLSATVLTTNPVAHLVALGTKRGIPARNFMLISESAQARSLDRVMDFLMGAATKAA